MVESNENNQEGILEEAVQRFVDAQLRGQLIDIDEYVRQYPGLEHHLRQRLQNLERIGALFSRLIQVDESDFADTATGHDLVGQKIGSFEIVEMIGRGGMGVVYLARDTKLDRSVAIKSMPPELSGDSTARMRFKREAKLLASLNHPNIAAIHDIIEQDDSGYLVLEYIPGQTLTERIKHKPLKLQEALSIGLQIAEALLGAYENGVTHRDIKPGNIKITPQGRVKVLDFGLAKAFSPHKENSDISITQPGRIVGTPAYMSPEQARGAPTDHRTDIWSFGCVMYEMLTGRLPFEGETATDTVARILEREPDWQGLPQNTPANIRVLLRRCLEKNPRQRLQHIGDAVIEINETLNVPANAPPLSAPVVDKSQSALWRLGIACGVVGLIIGAIAVGIALRSSAPSPVRGLRLTQRSVIPLPEGQTLALSRFTPFGFAQPAIALSPDGSHLVYVANVGTTSQLFLRPMSEMEPSPIPGTEGAFCPFFSPDSRWVGFFTKDKLKKVSLLGGNPVALCDAESPRGGNWGTNETITFVENQGGELTQVPVAGGATAPFIAGTEYAGENSYGNPEILPGGKWVLFSSRKDSYIKLVSSETGEIKSLVKDGYYARYLPTGHLVYAQAGVLLAVPFDLATLKVTGDAVPILEQVLLDSTYETAQYTFSRNGLLVYVPGDDAAKSIPVWINQDGTTEPLPIRPQIYGTPKLSPDGKQLAIVVGPEGKQDIYVYDVATGTSTRLTLKGDNRSPVWTPDGKRVAFLRHGHRVEKSSILWKSGDGSGEAELLYSSERAPVPSSWSPNGKRLAFFTGGVWVLPLEGSREPELIVDTEATEWAPAFSPDGRWIAYTSAKDGKFQIYVRPYPDNDWVRKISDDFGEESIWSPKGDKLFYRNGDKWMVVSISTEPEFTPGPPQVLFEGPYNNVPDLSYDVAPDGRFLVLQPEHDDSQIRELHVVLNWFDELTRLVPADDN